MVDIRILGLGCPKCKVTESQVKRAVEQLNLTAQITKVEVIEDIMAYHILSTPALVINGDIKTVGRVPSVEEIKRFLIEAKQTEGGGVHK
jgi:small redox-active disulfide protein 2